jgi:hypothetical protein
MMHQAVKTRSELLIVVARFLVEENRNLDVAYRM